MLILNEKKEAELIIKDPKLSFCTISKMVNLLIRYFVNNMEYDTETAIEETSKTLKKSHFGFIESQWHNTMINIANDAHKKPLRDIESIPITQKEIDKINELSTLPVRKVAFAYLVLAKVNYITYHHTWVNVNDFEMMKTANVDHNNDNFYNTLNILYFLGYISPAKSILKTSIKIEFADFEGEPAAEVTSLMNLGLWWEYINGAKYRLCVDCGVIFKPNSNSHIHCKKHIKPKVYICEMCGQAFDFPESGRKRKRCECCQREYKLERDKLRKRKERLLNRKKS